MIIDFIKQLLIIFPFAVIIATLAVGIITCLEKVSKFFEDHSIQFSDAIIILWGISSLLYYLYLFLAH